MFLFDESKSSVISVKSLLIAFAGMDITRGIIFLTAMDTSAISNDVSTRICEKISINHEVTLLYVRVSKFSAQECRSK